MATVETSALRPTAANLVDEEDVPLPNREESAESEEQFADLEKNDDVNGDRDSDQGLFGEDDNNDESLEQQTQRTLNDQELDSGDDIDRDDRVPDDVQEDQDEPEPDVELNREGAPIATHPIPKGDDKELYILKVPKFLGIEPAGFSSSNFQPPTTDLHSRLPPSEEFSAHKTAMKTIRWRRSPRNTFKLQSNARILRWSDGSLTLQLATDPSTQYPLPGKSLAPTQPNPHKPTPTSAAANSAKARKLNADVDSFTYLSAASISSAVVRTTNKLTTALTVEPSKDASDDAVALLQTRVATNRNNKEGETNGILGNIQIAGAIQDPELAQKQAARLEKDLLKQQKRREHQEMREKERKERTLGRRGLAGNAHGTSGLDEEDELGMGVRRVSTSQRKPKKRPNRTGEIFSDDDDIGRGRTREDEYDEEDDFVAPSDEEEEIVEDEDEDDIDEQIEREERARGKKRATPADEVEGQGASGDAETSVAKTSSRADAQDGSPLARSKRRRVIEDDDEE